MISNVKQDSVAEQVARLLEGQLDTLPFPAAISASWLAEGVVQLLPAEPSHRATVISAGVMKKSSPDNESRRAAELELEQAQTRPGFCFPMQAWLSA